MFAGSNSVTVLRRRLGHQSGQNAAVVGDRHIGLKLGANDAARIDDVRQQHVQPSPLGIRQVGPDRIPRAKQLMALSAIGRKDRLAGGRARRCATRSFWSSAATRSCTSAFETARILPQFFSNSASIAGSA